MELLQRISCLLRDVRKGRTIAAYDNEAFLLENELSTFLNKSSSIASNTDSLQSGLATDLKPAIKFKDNEKYNHFLTECKAVLVLFVTMEMAKNTPKNEIFQGFRERFPIINEVLTLTKIE